MKKLKVIAVGSGLRGMAYTNVMADQPDRFEVIAVAERLESRREYMKNKHRIPEGNCYSDWKPLLERPKMADIAVITTMDRLHFEPVMAAIRKGYDILLEKPVAPTPEECLRIADEAKKYGTRILVCHVLRYNDFFGAVKRVIDSGAIGKVMSIQHSECVGAIHQAHAFVRGNWGNSERSSCMLLQKSCHDLDLLQWLVGQKCRRVSSFGSLAHFKAENAPADAPEYCIDGCAQEPDCPYSALKIYRDNPNQLYRDVAAGAVNATAEQTDQALRTTIWGRCVYKCDNDVVDRQIVNLEFEDGTLADFNMCAFNQGGRFIRVMGTKGELVRSSREDLTLYTFADKKTQPIDVASFGNNISSGHGGGDTGLIRALYDYIALGKQSPDFTEIGISVENHMIAFAAEEARLSGRVVDVDEYVQSVRRRMV